MGAKRSINDWIESIVDGERIDFESALHLVESNDTALLAAGADNLRRQLQGEAFDLCSIINGKSGRCSENCKFCAQSSWYDTEIEEYAIVSRDEAVRQAKDNSSNGIERFSIVTAGRSLSGEQIDQFGEIYNDISRKTAIKLCASMGMLTASKAQQLRSYGVRRYHCNLESCKSYFPNICTTHTYDEKVETIKIARQAGMEVCSGGIFGIGENRQQRIELAFELRDLDVYSIPINILIPIPNTPLQNREPISLQEVIEAIAIFRFINPQAVIRLAGGRNQFGLQQYDCFTSGANGAIVGNYLTTQGNNLQKDLEHIALMNFKLPPKRFK